MRAWRRAAWAAAGLLPVLGIAQESASAPREPRTPIPVLTDADREAAVPAHGHHMGGDTAIHSYSLVNRLEAWNADPGTGQAWEAGGWIGGDINRLWWRTEGERVDSSTEEAQLEAMYGRSFSPWWDWVAGLRQDFDPGDAQTFAAFGIRGLAPQRFELSLTGYLGEAGQTALRFETGYELLFTNKLILQPLLEVNLYGRTDAGRGIGSGLSNLELGMRLRYEISRRFAPYAGVVYAATFGETADLRRAASEDTEDFRVVAGLRAWF